MKKILEQIILGSALTLGTWTLGCETRQTTETCSIPSSNSNNGCYQFSSTNKDGTKEYDFSCMAGDECSCSKPTGSSIDSCSCYCRTLSCCDKKSCSGDSHCVESSYEKNGCYCQENPSHEGM